MHSASNTRVSMVACLLGVCVMLLGAHGAPHSKHKEKKSTTFQQAYLVLNSSVPDTPHIRPVSNSSLSPWEYRLSHDDNRFPADVFEARCMYTGCLTYDGQETLDLLSVPIERQILVLRRAEDKKDKNGGYFFMLDYMTIAVGCTCVRPRVVQH